jgi:putative transposase
LRGSWTRDCRNDRLHRPTQGAHGVEPICRELPIAPSTYYTARSRPPSARAIEDEELKAKILEVYKANYEVYGVEKIWIALRRTGVDVGRDRVARLMGALGIEGLTRAKKPRTTKPAPPAQRPDDLVKRDFTAPGPNRLWVADLTYVATWAGFAYTAFIIDVYSRLIVGWRVSSFLRADLALDALEMAIWRRAEVLDDLVHHSDRGVQYLSVRYTERLGQEAGAAMRRAASRGVDTCATCHYAGDPARRPDCEHRAIVVYGAVALCRSCDARRSTVGKAMVGRSLVHGRDWRALEAIEAAAGQLRAAEDQVARAVAAARRLGHSWGELGAALGVSRQAAQQRFGSMIAEGTKDR